MCYYCCSPLNQFYPFFTWFSIVRYLKKLMTKYFVSSRQRLKGSVFLNMNHCDAVHSNTDSKCQRTRNERQFDGWRLIDVRVLTENRRQQLNLTLPPHRTYSATEGKVLSSFASIVPGSAFWLELQFWRPSPIS